MGFWPEVPDLEKHLKEDFSDPDAHDQAEVALGLAVGIVTEGRQPIEAGTTTEVIQGNGTDLLSVSYIPIRAVTSIVVDGQTLTDFDLSINGNKAGVIARRFGASWGAGPATVTYYHGYTNCPPSLKFVVLSLAGRTVHNPLSRDATDYPGFRAAFRLMPELSRTEQAIVDLYQKAPARSIIFTDRRRLFPR